MTEDATSTLTGALEDYLETIYLLVQRQPFARVRDIAQARDVKPGSVSPALRRLADLGLVKYVQREYVTLTPEGEKAARRILSRHQLLTRFFTEVLELAPEAAERDACAMEHNLSDEAMDALVRFFEFLGACPNSTPEFLERFHGCSLVHQDGPRCAHKCTVDQQQGTDAQSIHQLRPGQTGIIAQVKANGAIRQRLLDMGVLPGVEVKLERIAPTGQPIWIKLQNTQLALRKKEAEAVLLK